MAPFANRGILVNTIYPINISISVSDRATNKSVLNIERSWYDYSTCQMQVNSLDSILDTFENRVSRLEYRVSRRWNFLRKRFKSRKCNNGKNNTVLGAASFIHARVHVHCNSANEYVLSTLCNTGLRTFAPIVSAHPYCARLHAQIHVPRHASSACAKY